MIRLALAMVALLASTALADRKVDWSDYLEPPGAQKPMKVTPSPQVAEAQPDAKPAKGKRTAVKAKAKAKRKAPAARAKRRK